MSTAAELLLGLNRSLGTALLIALRASTAALIIGTLVFPANAQFWGDSWGGRQQPQQRQQPYNPFGGWGDRSGGFWGERQRESPRYYPRQRERVREPEREEPPDYSRAPPTTPRKDATIKIVVMGDANADWLAYGLEDAFSEKPEIGIVRKHRTDSGLIHYDQRRDREWPQIAREIITAEKPKYVVMMVGNTDRQAIREKVSTAAASAVPKISGQQPPKPNPSGATGGPSVSDPEQQPPEPPQASEHANMTEQARLASFGPWDFHTDKWELAYIRRIDATIAALKSAGVPVIWVGLPSQRSPKTTADLAYLNELYRSRAEKAGIVYVDVWEGFVDEAGKYSPQGPDYQGQTRRLRTGDGIHFTKFGARKLALYVEREIERSLSRVPVALPVPADQAPRTTRGKPNAPVRPEAGPVVPLTVPSGGSEKVLLGGPTERFPGVADPTITRVLSTGEAIAPTTGRADDFRWPPRNDITTDGAKVAPAAKE